MHLYSFAPTFLGLCYVTVTTAVPPLTQSEHDDIIHVLFNTRIGKNYPKIRNISSIRQESPQLKKTRSVSLLLSVMSSTFMKYQLDICCIFAKRVPVAITYLTFPSQEQLHVAE